MQKALPLLAQLTQIDPHLSLKTPEERLLLSVLLGAYYDAVHARARLPRLWNKLFEVRYWVLNHHNYQGISFELAATALLPLRWDTATLSAAFLDLTSPARLRLRCFPRKVNPQALGRSIKCRNEVRMCSQAKSTESSRPDDNSSESCVMVETNVIDHSLPRIDNIVDDETMGIRANC